MARLTLVQKRGKFALSLPHKILIDGHLLGVMKDREVSVEMPAGAYDITVQSMVPMISATQHVELPLRGEAGVFRPRAGVGCAVCGGRGALGGQAVPAFGQPMDVALRGVHQWLFRAVAHL